MTLTEDLALLLHDPATGKGLVGSTALPRGLAGAAVLDLVLAGRAEVTGEGRRARLVAVDGAPLHPVLDAAATRLGKPRAPKRAIEKLTPAVRDDVLAHLARRGLVRHEQRRVLGLFPEHRWPALDPAPREGLRLRVHAVLVDGVTPEPHDAALVSLLRAVDAEHRVVDGRRRDLRRRSKVVADGEWAGEAVRKAIADMHGAIAAGAAAGGAATSAT